MPTSEEIDQLMITQHQPIISGEPVDHSAIVIKVDKDGNTTLVEGKMGQTGLSKNHPDAPDYYKVHQEFDKNGNLIGNYATKRFYFRLPGNKTAAASASDQGNSDLAALMDSDDDSKGSGVSWDQLNAILNSWLTINPNIIVNEID